MTEDVIVQLTDSKVQNIPNFDPYSDHYYKNYLITADLGCIPPREPTVSNFREIKEYYIGDEQYTMIYKPHMFGEREFKESISKDIPQRSVMLTDGTKKNLSNDEYTEIIEEFGKLMNFQTLVHDEIIYEI